MILTDLRIPNGKPLIISFYAYTKYEDKNCIYVNKTINTGIMSSIYDNIKIYDKGKITKILSFFFRVCDASLSPQLLWTVDNTNYASLSLDYRKNNEEYFDKILVKVIEMIPKGFIYENNIEKIASIEIAYPIDWDVKYIKKERGNTL